MTLREELVADAARARTASGPALCDGVIEGRRYREQNPDGNLVPGIAHFSALFPGRQDIVDVAVHVWRFGDWIPAAPVWASVEQAWLLEVAPGRIGYDTVQPVDRYNILRARLLAAHSQIGLQLELF